MVAQCRICHQNIAVPAYRFQLPCDTATGTARTRPPYHQPVHPACLIEEMNAGNPQCCNNEYQHLIKIDDNGGRTFELICGHQFTRNETNTAEFEHLPGHGIHIRCPTCTRPTAFLFRADTPPCYGGELRIPPHDTAPCCGTTVACLVHWAVAIATDANNRCPGNCGVRWFPVFDTNTMNLVCGCSVHIIATSRLHWNDHGILTLRCRLHEVWVCVLEQQG